MTAVRSRDVEDPSSHELFRRPSGGFGSLTVCVCFTVALLAGDVGAAEPVEEGLSAYFAGDLDRAAVTLKGALRQAKGESEESAAATYFLARSFQELGLRGLALHYLTRAEAFSRWRVSALRELARIYLRVHEYHAVLDVVRRLPDGVEDGEVLYFGGVAAASLGQWSEAEAILARVPTGDPDRPLALYVRAQTRAAREDFDGALADLDVLLRQTESVELRDQARVLRGKLLYLEDRGADARREFAAVESAGAIGFEALRGLLLVRADAETVARSNISEARPTDAATLLYVRAVAAEDRGDSSAALGIREQLRVLLETRLRDLQRFAGHGPVKGSLERDLARFAGILRMEDWRRRASAERERLPESLLDAVEDDRPDASPPFEPEEVLFYDAWNHARTDSGLRGSIDLLARSLDVVADFEQVPNEAPFWKFWDDDGDRRLALGLAIIRLSDLERLLADHLHTSKAISRKELQNRQKESVDRAIQELTDLYLGAETKIPEPLSNLELHLEYKENDMNRLITSLPERSTDPVTSLLGNYVDILEDTRRYLSSYGTKLPSIQTDARALVKRMRKKNDLLGREITTEIHDVVTPTLRDQIAFFTRLAADNEGSLSRLYAHRLDAGKESR